jgi:hypothetical protein
MVALVRLYEAARHYTMAEKPLGFSPYGVASRFSQH